MSDNNKTPQYENFLEAHLAGDCDVAVPMEIADWQEDVRQLLDYFKEDFKICPTPVNRATAEAVIFSLSSLARYVEMRTGMCADSSGTAVARKKRAV